MNLSIYLGDQTILNMHNPHLKTISVIILLIFEKQNVASLPQMRVLFSNVSFVADPSFLNATTSFSNTQVNLTIVMFRKFESLYVDLHLDVRKLNNPSTISMNVSSANR